MLQLEMMYVYSLSKANCILTCALSVLPLT